MTPQDQKLIEAGAKFREALKEYHAAQAAHDEAGQAYERANGDLARTRDAFHEANRYLADVASGKA